MSNKSVWGAVCVYTLCVCHPNVAFANDIIWDNSVTTGVYNSDINWIGGIAPASTDRAIFDVGSILNNQTITPTFDNNLTNNALLIDRGAYLIDLAGYTYNLTGSDGFTVNGSTDTTIADPYNLALTGLANILTIKNGALYVTNDITFTGYGTLPSTNATFLNTTVSSLNGLIDFNEAASIGGGPDNFSPSDTVSLSSTNWAMSGDLTTGGVGFGQLTIDSTSSVSGVNGYIGRDFGSVGAITNDGSLDITSSLYVGGSSLTAGGAGTLDNTGVLTISDTLKVWSNGTANLGGTVNASSIDIDGVAIINSGAVTTSNLTGSGQINLNTFTLSTTNTDISGGLQFSGSGTLLIDSGVLNTGSQDLTLNGSDLILLNGATTSSITNTSIDGSSLININDSSFTTGSLVIDGSVNLNGGTVITESLSGSGQFNLNAGTLKITSPDFTISDLTPLGPTLTLSDAETLSIAGTTTIASTSQLILDGGTLFTDTLINNGSFQFNRGTLDLLNFTVGDTGLFGSTLQVNNIQKQVNIRGATTVDNGALLYVASGSFTSNSYINNGEIQLSGPTSLLAGGAISNNALITGDGRVDVALTNSSTGEIRVYSGDRLHFSGASNDNDGEVNILGGTAEFSSAITNSATGFIGGRGALISNGTITNEGVMAFSGGFTDVIGDVSNESIGQIVVSGGSTTTFYDDVVHNGAEIRVSTGSQAVYFGSVSGAGAFTGAGTNYFEGDLRPGNSPSIVTFEGDVVFGLTNTLGIEIGGLLAGSEYDVVDVNRDAYLSGILDVSFYDLGGGIFNAELGDSFDVLSAESIFGEFDLLTLAILDEGLSWDVAYLADAIGSTDIVRLSVVSAVPIPAAIWLFASGLLGLVGLARRNATA